MSRKSIAVLGECMVEIKRIGGHLKQSFGGDTLNTALYAARLARQAGQVQRVGPTPTKASVMMDTAISVSYFSALGSDSMSNAMLAAWREEGIGVAHVAQYSDKLPGLYMIENQPCGERDFHYWRNDSAARVWLTRSDEDALFETLKSFDLIYLSGITVAIQSSENHAKLMRLLTRLKQVGCKIAFDTNYRPILWVTTALAQSRFEQLYRLTDIALLTLEDEQLLFGDSGLHSAMARLSSFGMEQVVLKMGSAGCAVITKGETHFVPTQVVEHVVDTTAAGDSFNAAYLYQWLISGDANVAAQAGHRLAGEVIGHKGAIIPIEAMPNLASDA